MTKYAALLAFWRQWEMNLPEKEIDAQRRVVNHLLDTKSFISKQEYFITSSTSQKTFKSFRLKKCCCWPVLIFSSTSSFHDKWMFKVAAFQPWLRFKGLFPSNFQLKFWWMLLVVAAEVCDLYQFNGILEKVTDLNEGSEQRMWHIFSPTNLLCVFSIIPLLVGSNYYQFWPR